MKPRLLWPTGLCIPIQTSSRPRLLCLKIKSPSTTRTFTTSPTPHNWLAPKRGHTDKNRKGRPHVSTGGSTRGTTVIWGDYGLRMRDHDRRISAAQMNIGLEAIKKRLRGQRYRLYTRVCSNIGVYTSGNEMRMGKGKGSFDYWAARVGVNRMIFELKGDLHEEIVRDAFRMAGNKMPGLYEFVRKGDAPVMGITKMENGITREDLMRPRVKMPGPSITISVARIPAASPP